MRVDFQSPMKRYPDPNLLDASNPPLRTPHAASSDALVDAITLLNTEFHPNARPSLRWLRSRQQDRSLPFLKVGAKVFFRPAEVRAALDKKFTVRSRCS